MFAVSRYRFSFLFINLSLYLVAYTFYLKMIPFSISCGLVLEQYISQVFNCLKNICRLVIRLLELFDLRVEFRVGISLPFRMWVPSVCLAVAADHTFAVSPVSLPAFHGCVRTARA